MEPMSNFPTAVGTVPPPEPAFLRCMDLRSETL